MASAGSPDALRPPPAWASATGLVSLPPESVEAPPLVHQRLVDRLHRYCWGFDERNVDVLADCFTADGSWAGDSMGETKIGPFEGREAVVAWLTRYWDHQRDQRRHVVTNVVVTACSDDEATLLSYLLLFGSKQAASRLESIGLYRLDCRREGEQWRIASLNAGFDSPFWRREVTALSPEARDLFGVAAEGVAT